MDYLVPTAVEMPEATIVKILEETPRRSIRWARKAWARAAVGGGRCHPNAVADALAQLGVAITELPLSPDRLARLVRERAVRP